MKRTTYVIQYKNIQGEWVDSFYNNKYGSQTFENARIIYMNNELDDSDVSYKIIRREVIETDMK